MQTKSLVLAAAVAWISLAAAEQERPRIYFPRHIKRQFSNATITRQETFPPPESTSSSESSTTKRQSLEDFLTSLKDPFGLGPSPSDTPDAPIPSPDDGEVTVTTIVISSIITVTAPGADASTGGFPPIVLLPTPTVETSTTSEAVEGTSSEAEKPATSSGILLLPTGIVFPSSTESETTTTSVAPTESTTEPETTTTTTPPVEETTTSVEETTTTSVAETTTPPVEETTTTTPVAETTTPPVEETTTTPVEETTTTPVAETTTPPVAETTTPPVVETTTTPVEETTTPAPVETTTTPVPEETKPPNPIESIISQLTSLLPDLPTLIPDPPVVNTTSTEIPAEPTPDPVTTTTTTAPPPDVTEPPVTDPPPVSDETTTTVGPTITPDPPGGPANTTSTEPPPPPTTTITDLPPTDTSGPTITPDPPVGNTTTSVDPPETTYVFPTNSTVPEDPPITTTPTTTEPPSTIPVTEIQPTGTITDSELWLPTTIVAEQSTRSTPTGNYAPISTAPLPSELPQVISPDSDPVVQPEDTTMIQIGFNFAENYHFVSNNPLAAAQIFTYLPQALADGGSFDVSKIKIKRLVPLDTTAALGYITTLAMLYYPTHMVETLRIDIKIPNSPLYNNPDALIYNLTANINSAIDIIPGPDSDDPDATGGGASPTNTGAAGNDMFNQPTTDQTPMQKGTAAAIGLGAVGVAAAYGAAMFIIARRYKQRKQAHRRSSSLANSSEMRYTGSGSPAMMGGALLSRDFSSYGGVAAGGSGGRNSHGSGRSGANNSARTAYISAPMAAENSLGWN